MSLFKNKFVIVVIVAILAGGVTGLYLSGKPKAPDNVVVSSSSGASTEKVGEVIQKLNELTK